MARSGSYTEEAHTRVLPTMEPEGDGQWKEVEMHTQKEEEVCREQVLTWASSLLVPVGELALLPCQAGEEVRWDRQGEPIEVLDIDKRCHAIAHVLTGKYPVHSVQSSQIIYQRELPWMGFINIDCFVVCC